MEAELNRRDAAAMGVRLSRAFSFFCASACCMCVQLRTVFSKGRKVLVRNEKGFFYQEGEIVKMAVRHIIKRAEAMGGLWMQDTECEGVGRDS